MGELIFLCAFEGFSNLTSCNPKTWPRGAGGGQTSSYFFYVKIQEFPIKPYIFKAAYTTGLMAHNDNVMFNKSI